MHCFERSKYFPLEEKLDIMSQLHSSSGGASAQLAEVYRKKYYPKLFVSKLIDEDSGNPETGLGLDFAEACSYLTEHVLSDVRKLKNEVGRLFHYDRKPR